MKSLPKHLELNIKGHLSVDGADCVELAEKFGTPLFVISENTLRNNYRRFYEAFKSKYPQEIVVCCGVKANWGLAVRKVLSQEGAGGDAFGRGELYAALMGGADPAKIVMNGSNKPEDVLLAAVEAGIVINIDSLDELYSIVKIAEKRNKVVNFCPRIRLGLKSLDGKRHVDPRFGSQGGDIGVWTRESKFGMEPKAVYDALEIAQNSTTVKMAGLMHHAGIPRRAGFLTEEIDEMFEHIAIMNERHGWEPEILNIGGGYVTERFGKGGPAIESVANTLISSIKANANKLNLPLPKLFLEPGRWCVESAGMYLAKVGSIKKDVELTNRAWVYVDGSINEMPDPYDPHDVYHHVVVANNPSVAEKINADICGQLCNGEDVLVRDREIPAVNKGDIVAMLDMGAYNEAYSNQSNAMPRSACVMVSNGKTAVVRRRETIQDIFSRDLIPYWLFSRDT